MSNKKIIFLLGPTGIGKSASAVKLAKKINAQIISCDSMQIYRRMGILTSQPTSAQRKAVKHHLIGSLSPGREYDVAKYRRQALLICDQLHRKDKIPLFVGGSGLYYSAIVDGIFPSVPQDKIIRERLEKQAKLKGRPYLYRRLQKIDPGAAKKIHPHDLRRIIRALEVYLKTGKLISQLQKERAGLGSGYAVKIFGLNAEREFLYQKIDQRVDEMFRQGLIKEVRRLLKHKLSLTAKYAIGINELKGYFAGEYPLAEAKRLMQRNSRHYAKRQLTWFRKDKRIQWININQKDSPTQIAAKLWKKLS